MHKTALLIKMAARKAVVTFVTGNQKKLEEVKKIVGANFPFTMVNKKIDTPRASGLYNVCRHHRIYILYHDCNRITSVARQ